MTYNLDMFLLQQAQVDCACFASDICGIGTQAGISGGSDA